MAMAAKSTVGGWPERRDALARASFVALKEARAESIQVRVWDLGLFPVSGECRGFMRSAHQRASSAAMVEGLKCGLLWTDGRTVGRVASS